jgi:Family of unknown function (DUF5519)
MATRAGWMVPTRNGPKPSTTSENPHTQLDQNAPVELQDRLRDHALGLPGVRRGRSQVSVPGAVAFYLDVPVQERSIPQFTGGEWGHIHPHYDGSLHINVPTALAEQLIAHGWAEYHNVVARGLAPPIVIMLYGPRDEEELAVAQSIVEEAYLAAGGASTDKAGSPLGLAHD